MVTPQAPNMSDVLNRPSNSIERPKPLPVGTYQWQVKGQPRFDKSKNNNKFVEFILVPLTQGGDVDENDLAEALTVKATGERRPLAEKQMKPQFYYETDYGLALLKEFLDACQVEEPEGCTIGQRIPGAMGTQVLGMIKHSPTQDGKGVRAEISEYGKVE